MESCTSSSFVCGSISGQLAETSTHLSQKAHDRLHKLACVINIKSFLVVRKIEVGFFAS